MNLHTIMPIKLSDGSLLIVDTDVDTNEIIVTNGSDFELLRLPRVEAERLSGYLKQAAKRAKRISFAVARAKAEAK